MGNTTQFFLFLALVYCIYISPSSGLECFECNMYLCSRASTNSEQCKLTAEYRQASNITYRQEIYQKMVQLAGCHETTKTNCDACIKVETVLRRHSVKDTFQSDEVLSKMCWRSTKGSKHQELSPENDKCVRTGPKHGSQTVCHCHQDLCNAANSVAISSLTSVMTAVLVRLFTL